MKGVVGGERGSCLSCPMVSPVPYVDLLGIIFIIGHFLLFSFCEFLGGLHNVPFVGGLHNVLFVGDLHNVPLNIFLSM